MSVHLTVYEALSAVVQRRAAHTALVYEGSRLSYADFLQRVDHAADALVAYGVGRGNAFALYAQNCPEFLYCYYAAAKIGAVYVPVNPNVSASEMGYIFGHSDAKLLFHDEIASEKVWDPLESTCRHASLSIL